MRTTSQGHAGSPQSPPGPHSGLAQSRLAGNILALYSVQGLNYLLPLIALPYLLRVLGPAPYGAIVLAQSLCGYLTIFTDFGFNFSATRAVSLARHDPDRLARILWSTLCAKALLLLAGAVLLLPVILAAPGLRTRVDLIGACSLQVLGSVLLPQWYLQGLERMRSLAVLQLVARAMSLLAVVLLVRSPQDVVMAAVTLSLPVLLAGILSLLCLRRIAPVRWQCPAGADVLAALRDGWPLFLANAATSIYVITNPFLLGLVAGDTAVALYGVGHRVSLAAFSLFTPVLQAIYPRASLLFGRSVAGGRAFMRRLLVWLATPAAFLSLLLIGAAPLIVTAVGGRQYTGAVPVLRILGGLPLILTLATLAQTTLISVGRSRSLLRIYAAAATLSLLLLPPLAIRHQAVGAAVSLLVVELTATLLMSRASLCACRAH
jgi:O-antigen/teichoic acid export membrane protein